MLKRHLRELVELIQIRNPEITVVVKVSQSSSKSREGPRSQSFRLKIYLYRPRILCTQEIITKTYVETRP